MEPHTLKLDVLILQRHTGLQFIGAPIIMYGLQYNGAPPHLCETIYQNGDKGFF